MANLYQALLQILALQAITHNNNNQATVQPASGNYTVNVYLPFGVRTGPSTSHTTVASGPQQGQVVQVVGEVQDWFKINYAGQTAYVSKDYVTKGGSNDNVTSRKQPTRQQEENNNGTVPTGGTLRC